jgi:hypothetical protein
MVSAPSDSPAERRRPLARAGLLDRLQQAALCVLQPERCPGLDTFRLDNLKAIDRTGIEAFLEELRTYLDHHVVP